MSVERRKYLRVVRPLSGSWTGASGRSVCRISDISWGGCFINSLAEPRTGERTVVTLEVDDRAVSIEATVLVVDKPLGFSVQFDPLTPEQIEGLTPLLGESPRE